MSIFSDFFLGKKPTFPEEHPEESTPAPEKAPVKAPETSLVEPPADSEPEKPAAPPPAPTPKDLVSEAKPEKPVTAERVIASVRAEAIQQLRLEEEIRQLLQTAELEENKLYHATRIGKKWYGDDELLKAEATIERLMGEKPARAESGWYRRDADGKLITSKPATDEEIFLFRVAQRCGKP